MDEAKRLEMLSESVKECIDELQSLLEHSDDKLLKAKKNAFQKELENIISNLESTNDAIYCVYEDLNCKNTDELQQNFDVLKDILQEKLSYDEIIDMRIKYGIEFGCGGVV